jgi:hypothetical protein
VLSDLGEVGLFLRKSPVEGNFGGYSYRETASRPFGTFGVVKMKHLESE